MENNDIDRILERGRINRNIDEKDAPVFRLTTVEGMAGHILAQIAMDLVNSSLDNDLRFDILRLIREKIDMILESEARFRANK